jgi:hypothetical protein
MEVQGWIFPESSSVFSREALELEELSIATLTVEGNSDAARDSLLDPVSMLADNIPGVDESWSVQLHRPNAEVAAGPVPRSGARKLVLLVLLIVRIRVAVVTAYRIPSDEVPA